MIGMVIPSSFANEIPLDNKEKILEQKIPTWVKSVGIFLVEDKITNDEFDNILKYLIKTEIILPEQTSFKNFITSIEFYSNYKSIKNSQLNTLSNSDAIDISKYKDNQECRTELKKINKLTIQTMKECNKIISNSHVKTPKTDDFMDRILESRNYRQIDQQEQNKLQQELQKYTSPKDCLEKSKADDGVVSASEKSLCDRVNRTWAVDTQIYDNFGNLVGTQALNNCNDSNCDSYGSFNMDAEVRYALNRADAYAKASLSEVDKYANQWVNGQISYGEYERKAMASMDYYSNQYASEMTSYWDSKYGYYP